MNKIIIPHYQNNCKCLDYCNLNNIFVRDIIVDINNISYNIIIPLCIERYSSSPIKDAMNHLSELTGFKIVTNKEIEGLFGDVCKKKYINLYKLEDNTNVLYQNGFYLKYYLKRDLLKTILKLKPKCKICNKRCNNSSHDDLQRFLEKRKSQNEKKGYIYFLLLNNNLCKIGFSENPNKRISTHKSNIPGKIKILGIINGSKDDELFLHYVFRKHLKHKREWFNFKKIKFEISKIIELYDTKI